MAKTVFFDGKASERAVLILFNKQGIVATHMLGIFTTIGRATDQSNCDIKICSPIVSRSHGEIAVIDGEYHYRDINSTNGTYINNVLIGHNSTVNRQAVILKDGDVLCFDIRKDGQSRPDCVYALFTTYCDANSEWDALELKDDIAEICGFNCKESFYRVFRSEQGITPAAYRKSNRVLQNT